MTGRVGWVVLYVVAGAVGWAAAPWTGAHPVELTCGATLVYVVVQAGRPERAFWWYTLGVLTLVGAPQTALLGVPGDDLGRSMLALVGWTFPVVALAGWSSVGRDRSLYWGGLVATELALVICFATTNLLTFYIAFEALAFPMFVQIGRFGSNPGPRRRAAFKFFVYTLIGSTTALPGLMVVYRLVGSLEVVHLQAFPFTLEQQILLAGCFGLPFLVKIPVVPFHLWLVEAHVEAPAPSSMVLAALLLKTGGYGYLRWVTGVYPQGAAWWSTGVVTLGVVGAVASSLFALVQTDLKRMMAYSSVAHMGVMCVGLGVATPLANQGAVYTMLAHGAASAGLFAGVGVLYDRYHTRDIRGLGGLATGAPWLGSLFFVLCLANFGFPLTGNFVGEFVVLAEVFRVNLVVGLVLGVPTFLALAYTMWGYNRVFFGTPHPRAIRVEDLYPTEWAALVICVGWVAILGVAGGVYCESTHECYHLAAAPRGPW